MILSRLTQSMREQNWTAIWIEFVLLVGGVFLGIQVSNWNAARTHFRLVIPAKAGIQFLHLVPG